MVILKVLNSYSSIEQVCINQAAAMAMIKKLKESGMVISSYEISPYV